MYNINSRAPVPGKTWIIPQPAQVPMKSHHILAAALLLCSIAACGQIPTGSDRQAQPAGASFDGGGFVIGSGIRSEEPGSTTTQDTGGYGMGSGGASSGNDTGTPEAEPEDAERSGGYGMGSGI